jgi:hypothetical protein
MTNAIISLALTIAIATTLGGQMASAAYRESSVRAMHAGDQLAPIARERALPTHVAAS